MNYIFQIVTIIGLILLNPRPFPPNLVVTRRAVLFIHWKAVFIVGFTYYALLWRYAFPYIDPSSERLTNLHFIASYMPGTTLPPVDTWLPPYKLDFYYTFQHYSAALMGRLFGTPELPITPPSV